MPLPFLAIATGAVNIGKKIFGKIKERQAKKKTKQAAKQAKKDAAIAKFESLLPGAAGSTPITESGNLLAGFKSFLDNKDAATQKATDINIPGGGSGDDDDGAGSSGGGMMEFFKSPIGIIIAAVAALIIGKKLKLF